MAKDQPDVNHLDVGGGGKAFHLAHEDGGHHQHGGQVHAQGRLKEERLEEGGGKGDCSQKNGREVGGHHLACDLPHTAPERCQPEKFATLSFSAFLVVCDQDKKLQVGQQIL